MEAFSFTHNQGYLAHGHRQPCSDLEMNAVECLEAYGTHKGVQKCWKYMEDFNECKQSSIRLMRRIIMREERAKQVLKGERKPSEFWGPKYSYDSFYTDTFTP